MATTAHEHRAAADLTLAPEIELLRGLLRRIGSDDAEERESATAEAIGMSRVIAVIARSVEIEQRLRAGDSEDDGAQYRSIIAHALDLLDRPPTGVGSGQWTVSSDGSQAADVTGAAEDEGAACTGHTAPT